MLQPRKRRHAKIPAHVGIIMDGNGRWAKKRAFPRFQGHQHGLTALRNAVKFCIKTGISVLTVYAFSTENWFRPAEEVQYLMKLMEKAFSEEIGELDSAGVKVCLIGCRETLSEQAMALWSKAETDTQNNTKLILNVAFNYGGRKEITHAVQEIAQLVKDGSLAPEAISEETIGAFLYTKHCPDPDLVIRTGGEFRISNFLLWQSAYAEWFITDTLWPDFGEETFQQALDTYNNRERRFGRVQDTEQK